MKSIQLKNSRYEAYYYSFKEWLETLGYSDQVVYNQPNYLREFLSYLEAKQIEYVAEAPKGIMGEYLAYLQDRKNHRRAGKLSNTSVNMRIYAVEQFSKYLLKEHGIFLPVTVGRLPESHKAKKILTTEEVEQLYKMTDSDYLGLRDRAMLSLFYGCGLRCSEVVNLDMSDMLWEKHLVYIRKAKNHHERLVPMTKNIREDLENYTLYSRPFLIRKKPWQKSFLVGYRSHRMQQCGLAHRLKELLQASGITSYKSGITLHSLRHSIGTHLLQKGMKLDDIRQFLGHLSLESTQIYTHLLHELDD